MKLAAVLLLAVSVTSLWRETNSHAAAARGAKAYAKQQYADAVKAYGEAQQLAPSARNAFNLGTAQIAAGQREQGSATLAEAIKDPELRASAYFNRGNSALGAKAFDHAIRDYTEALKANPRLDAAKRNLEIALARRDAAQAAAGGQRNKQGQQEQKQPQSPAGGQEKPKTGELDLEALLRSVAQQEQEELQRMKGKAAEPRVGW